MYEGQPGSVTAPLPSVWCTSTLINVNADTFTDRSTLVTPDELRDLESDCDVRTFPAGSILMGQGERPKFTLYILKGYAKVVTKGPPEQIMAIRQPGETVGEMGVITGDRRSASIFAFDEVQALDIPGSRWLRFLMEHPRANLALSYLLSERLREATERNDISLLSAEQRLANAIVKGSHVGRPTPNGISLSFTQQEFANLAGISLDSVKQIMRSFRERNLVDTARKLTIVRDLDTLRTIAQRDTNLYGPGT